MTFNTLLPKVASPQSTGGAGYHFENEVITAFSALMLFDGFLPDHHDGKIRKIALQCRWQEHYIDDCKLFVGPEENTSHFLCQIKKTIGFTKSNKEFRETLIAAWEDFSSSNFTKEKDYIVLATGFLKAKKDYSMRRLLQLAKTNPFEEFSRKIDDKLFLESKDFIDVANATFFIINEYKFEKEAEILTKEDFYNFLKHFYLWIFDLDLMSSIHRALLSSIISKHIDKPPFDVWNNISYYVRNYALDAGELEKDQLYAKLFPMNKQSEKLQIEIDKSDLKNLALISLIGKWDNTMSGDRTSLERIFQKNYADIELILQNLSVSYPDIIEVFLNKWNIKSRKNFLEIYPGLLWENDVNNFLEIALNTFSTYDQRFLVERENRWSEPYGNIYSKELLEGISGAFVILSNIEVKNLSTMQKETKIQLSLNKIFSSPDWKNWATLNNVLPELATADPNTFISAIENMIERHETLLNEWFLENNATFFTQDNTSGLKRALETLSWEEDYLPRITSLLLRLSAVSHNFSNTKGWSEIFRSIFLPWYPQTLVAFEKRLEILDMLNHHSPKIALEFLATLLPTGFGTTTDNYVSEYSNKKTEIIEHLEKVKSEGITNFECEQQYSEISSLFVSISLKADFGLTALKNIQTLGKLSLNTLTEKMKNLSITDNSIKFEIWKELKKHVIRSRNHQLSTHQTTNTLVNKFNPKSSNYYIKYLFSGSLHDTIYIKNNDYIQAQKKLIRQKNTS